MNLTDIFNVECPNCHCKIGVPFMKRIKAMTLTEIGKELARGAIEAAYTRHTIDWDEYCELLEEIDA